MCRVSDGPYLSNPWVIAMAEKAPEPSANAPVSPLPLIDRRWVLLNSAHAELAKNNSGVRAARQIEERLRNRDLRSMIQRDYPERDSKPEREQLSELYWDGYELEYARNMLHVFPRQRMFRSIFNPGLDLQQQGYTFFVWGPDLQKCFGAETADALKPPAPTKASPKRNKRSGTKAARAKRPLQKVGGAIIEKWCGENGYSKGVPPEVPTYAVWKMMKAPKNWNPMCVKLGYDPNEVRPPKTWHTVDAWIGRR